MTKRDYELIAKVLKYSMNHLNGNSAEDIMNMTISNMGGDLWASNNKLDQEEFEREAGYCAKVPCPDTYDNALGQTRN